jgi:hypothetical protein
MSETPLMHSGSMRAGHGAQWNAQPRFCRYQPPLEVKKSRK